MDYFGQPVRSLENKFVRLDYLAQAGPRLVRLVPAGTQVNLLAETPQKSWVTDAGEFHIWGGHRLWHSPEMHARTDIPDDTGLQVEPLGVDAVRLSQPADASGIYKSIEVTLAPDRGALSLHHLLRNDGLWPVQVAPWAITQVPIGGQAIIPCAAPFKEGLLPNRLFVFWPYSNLQDPRLHISDDFIRGIVCHERKPSRLACSHMRAGLGMSLAIISCGNPSHPRIFTPAPTLAATWKRGCRIFSWKLKPWDP